jgi:hypothetical protein
MDFIFFSSLIGVCTLALTVSYDICCQWSRKLAKRMSQLPYFMQLPEEQLRTAKFVLPKFHIYNHGIKCVLNYSLSFLRWSAASDLEDPERWWAHINPISMSTKEMSEGSRHDTIDDHARSWNWRKIVGFGVLALIYYLTVYLIPACCAGDLFRFRLKKALVMQTRHGDAFVRFNDTFPPAVVNTWDKMVSDWDKDKSKKNPYEEPVASKPPVLQSESCYLSERVGTTMTDMQLELANEEREDVARGWQSLHDVSAGKWLAMGLDLEEQQ